MMLSSRGTAPWRRMRKKPRPRALFFTQGYVYSTSAHTRRPGTRREAPQVPTVSKPVNVYQRQRLPVRRVAWSRVSFSRSGTTSSGGPHHTLANQLHVSSSTRCVAIVAVQYGPRVSPDHVVAISATSVAHPVLLHLRHHVLQQRAQPERAHRACATSPPAGRAVRPGSHC